MPHRTEADQERALLSLMVNSEDRMLTGLSAIETADLTSLSRRDLFLCFSERFARGSDFDTDAIREQVADGAARRELAGLVPGTVQSWGSATPSIMTDNTLS